MLHKLFGVKFDTVKLYGTVGQVFEFALSVQTSRLNRRNYFNFNVIDKVKGFFVRLTTFIAEIAKNLLCVYIHK